MATRHRAIVVTRWKSTPGRNDPEILDDIPAGSGISVSDIVGQPDANIPPTPNVYICEVSGLTPAQMTALNGMNKYFVLMSASYEDTTGAEIASTYDDVPTVPQLTALKNAIQTRFPDVDDDKLTDAGQAIIRNGLTRRQVLDLLIRRWRRFARA